MWQTPPGHVHQLIPVIGRFYRLSLLNGDAEERQGKDTFSRDPS